VPIAASILALDSDPATARRARDADVATDLRGQADRALSAWRARQATPPSLEQSRGHEHALDRDTPPDANTDRTILYDPWDHGL
jgi:hypothetical protein